MRFILMLIVAIAALNIISGLVMLVKNKGRDIAILRTMGAGQGAILRIFFMAGAAIGADRHRSSGLAFGVLFCLNIEAIQQLRRVGDRRAGVQLRHLFPRPRAGQDRLDRGGAGRRPGRWARRSSSPCRRPGGPRGSIRWRRFAMSEPVLVDPRPAPHLRHRRGLAAGAARASTSTSRPARSSA